MDWIQKLSDAYEKLAGAPGAILLVFCLVAVGFALRAWPSISNNRIPAILIACGMLFFVLAPDRITDPAKPGYLSLRLWCGRTFAMGCIAGVAAWFIYRIITKKIEKKLLNGDFNTVTDLQKAAGDKPQPPKP